jgi:predicted membrane protein
MQLFHTLYTCIVYVLFIRKIHFVTLKIYILSQFLFIYLFFTRVKTAIDYFIVVSVHAYVCNAVVRYSVCFFYRNDRQRGLCQGSVECSTHDN